MPVNPHVVPTICCPAADTANRLAYGLLNHTPVTALLEQPSPCDLFRVNPPDIKTVATSAATGNLWLMA